MTHAIRAGRSARKTAWCAPPADSAPTVCGPAINAVLWHYRSLEPGHKTQKGTRIFFQPYGGIALGSHRGETKQAVPRFQVFERQSHHRFRQGREAQRAAWCKTAQTEELCCKLPFAFSQINAFLEPYKAQIFSKGRPASLAINGFACSGDVKQNQ
jgi:hypothetical protein